MNLEIRKTTIKQKGNKLIGKVIREGFNEIIPTNTLKKQKLK